MWLALGLWASVLGGACAGAAVADGGAAPDARSADTLAFLQPTDGLVIDAGAGVNMHPRRIGLKALTLDPIPVLEVQWGPDAHLSLADGATYTPIHLGPLSLGAVVEPKQDYAAVRLAHGLRTADRTEAGGLARLATPVGVLELRARHSLDGDDTQSADLAFDTALKATSRLFFALEARTSWSTDAFVLPGRRTRTTPVPPDLDKSADVYSVGAQAAVIWRLSGDWWMSGLVGDDQIVRARSEALVLKTRSVPQVAIVVTRRFRLF